MKRLCAGQPPEFWETGDEGNRLAILICQRCPFRDTCLKGDPNPVGVIRGGVAFSNACKPLPMCECGYPNVDYRGGKVIGRCGRCTGVRREPTKVRVRPRAEVDEAVVQALMAGRRPLCNQEDKREAMRRLWASGHTHEEVAQVLGVTRRAVVQAAVRAHKKAAMA